MALGMIHPNRSNRLKMCRCRCSKTQTEVATALGISLEQYQMLESGERETPDIIMYKCSRLLDAPELMCGINPSKFRSRGKPARTYRRVN